MTFNDNGTLSYVARRTAVFLPEMNSVDLNATLFVPNLAVLGMASYLWDATFFTKFLFNVLTRNLGSEAIVRISVDDYLWNNSDPILEVARNIAPSMVPVSNMGILSRVSRLAMAPLILSDSVYNRSKKLFLIWAPCYSIQTRTISVIHYRDIGLFPRQNTVTSSSSIRLNAFLRFIKQKIVTRD